MLSQAFTAMESELKDCVNSYRDGLVPATDGQGRKTGGKMRSRGLIFFSPLFEAVVTQVGLKLEVHLP